MSRLATVFTVTLVIAAGCSTESAPADPDPARVPGGDAAQGDGGSPSASDGATSAGDGSTAGDSSDARDEDAPVAPVTGGIPTPATTGYLHTGVTLKSCDSFKNGSGNYDIFGTPAGVVVDGCTFLGNVVLHPGGPITLRRSLVKPSGCPNASPESDAGMGIRIVDGAGPVVIEDTEVTSANTTDPSQPCGILLRTIVGTGGNKAVTLTRVYAHGARSGMDFTGEKDVTIQDSYHAFNYNPPLPGQTSTCQNRVEDRQHASAIRLAGGSSNIRFLNTVLGLGTCGNASGLIATYPEGGANHGIQVVGGLWILQEEGYGIAAGYTKASEQQNYDFTVSGLKISTEYNTNGCAAGCAQNWNDKGGPIGGVGSPKVWQNVTKYNPGKPDHGQPITP